MMNKVKNYLIWCYKKLCAFLKWYKKLYQGRKWYTKTAIGFLSCIVAFLAYLGMVDMNFLWLFGKSPGFYTIMNPETNEASEIYSADGVLIGKFFNENRTPVKYEDVNPVFWEALIATEDERFYKHHGIDFPGLVGAAKDALLRHDARGVVYWVRPSSGTQTACSRPPTRSPSTARLRYSRSCLFCQGRHDLLSI